MGTAFQQHLKSFTLTSMTPMLRVFFSFSPSSSFYSPASILMFSNMLSHLALFFMALKLQIRSRFIKYGASNIYQLFVCSLLTLKNNSAQLQVCSSLTDHLTLHMFPNYKNQDEILELTNWRKSELSSTHTHTHKKLLQILRFCFVFQATRRNVTIIRKYDSVVHTFKAKD